MRQDEAVASSWFWSFFWRNVKLRKKNPEKKGIMLKIKPANIRWMNWETKALYWGSFVLYELCGADYYGDVSWHNLGMQAAWQDFTYGALVFHSVLPAGDKTCHRLEKSQVKFTALLMNAWSKYRDKKQLPLSSVKNMAIMYSIISAHLQKV